MTVLLSIGDFSRMTHLSVKALRHYHEVGVLEPAHVDADSGYRYYRPDQVGIAQVVRRFRDLGMPLDEIRVMVRAPDSQSRNRAIVAHLDRMEQRLAETHDAVVSLRTLLQEQPQTLRVERRLEPATATFAVTATVAAGDVVAWWLGAFQELHREIGRTGAVRTGADGALFGTAFFEADAGEITAFVPATGGTAPSGRVVRFEVPAARVAAVTHRGPFSDLDRTYGALGTWVAEHAVGAPGPARERYLPAGRPEDLLNHTTEVSWPVSDAG